MRAFRVVAAAVAIALAGCSGPPVPPAGSQGTAGGWTVSATLEVYPDGTATACYGIWHTYPPDCMGGMPVTQFGITRLPFSGVAKARGAYMTPTMKLTGKWTGSSLALTAPPTQTAAETSPLTVWSSTVRLPVAQMQAGVPTAAGLRDQEVLNADLRDLERRGIVMLENGFDATGLYMLVAAADPASVDLLRSRYNVHQIDSWLRPVP
jgi:hypothetical protein